MSSRSVSTSSPFQSHNKLLASLPSGEYQRVAPLLRTVSLRLREVIQKQDQPIDNVYFLTSGACSLVKNLHDGHVGEVAIVGGEGVIGASIFFGQWIAECDALVLLPNSTADVMSADTFSAEMDHRGTLFDRVTRFNQALMSQIMQTTVCNGLHSAEERCCRWLLMAHDRAGSDEFAFTHDLIASMLSVRRPTVTVIIGALQHAGVIQYRPKSVRIVEREKLEAVACECYRRVKSSMSRLLPESEFSLDGSYAP